MPADESFYRLWKNQELCDYTICCEDSKVEFKAHKKVLESNSEYFKTVFYTGFRDVNKNEKVEFNDVDAETMQLLLEYCYSNRFTISSPSDAARLLKLSNRLLVYGLENLCSEYIKHYYRKEASTGDDRDYRPNHGYDIPSFISCWLVASQLDKVDIVDVCRLYLTTKCNYIIEDESILELDVDKFELLILYSTLYGNDVKLYDKRLRRKIEYQYDVKKEAKYYNVLLNWLSYEPERENFEMFKELVQFAQYFKYGKNILNSIISDNECYNSTIRKENEEFFDNLTNWANRLIHDEDHDNIDMNQITNNSSNEDFIYFSHVDQPSYGMGFCNIKVSKYQLNDSFDLLCDFDINENTTSNNNKIIINNDLYIELFDNNKYLAVVDEKRNYFYFHPVKSSRNSATFIHHKGFVYSIGGHNSCYKAHNKVKRFSIKEKKWCDYICSDMCKARVDPCVSIYNDQIYATGGEEHDIYYQNSIERYNIKENKWEIIVYISLPLNPKGLLCYNEKLYVISGKCSAVCNGRQSTCIEPVFQSYDLVKKEWQSLPKMNKCYHYNVDLRLCNNTIIGLNQIREPYSVELYDLNSGRKGQWIDRTVRQI